MADNFPLMTLFGGFAGANEQRRDNFMTKENTTMRKLKLQVQMTVDGYIAGLNGEMDFMVWNWDDELKQYVKDITETVDCIRLYQGLWCSMAQRPMTA
jgi:hypothetical protein